MNLKHTFLLLSLITFFSFSSKASHLMGSDITWTCFGKDSFLIELALYRDCNGIDISNAIVPLKCKSTGTTFMTLNISKPAPVDVTPTGGYGCTRCQSKTCSFPYGIEQYRYQKLVYLGDSIPSSCCEVLITFSTCCRNSNISTGAANKGFYTEAMFNRCISPCDNGSVFTNPPIAMICIANDFSFCHGILDVDVDPVTGELWDSLSYEWVQPLSSEGVSVDYDAPYQYDKPLFFWGFPNDTLDYPRGLRLEKCCGNFEFRPMKIESTIMAVAVKEWRYDPSKKKRILIGQTRRDIQIIVIVCRTNNQPVLGGPYFKKVYEGNTVSFNIATNDLDSHDTLKLECFNSLPGAIWTVDKSNTKHPVGKLSWTPGAGMSSPVPYVFTVEVKDDAYPVSGQLVRAYQILVDSPTGITEEITESRINVYYYNGVLKLGSEQNLTNIEAFDLIDMSGKVVRSYDNIRASYCEFTPNVKAGNYIVRIIRSDDHTEVHKITVTD